MAKGKGDGPTRLDTIVDRVDAIESKLENLMAAPEDLADMVAALEARLVQLEAEVADLGKVASRAVLSAPAPLTEQYVREAVDVNPRARFRCLREYKPAGLRQNDVFAALDRFSSIDVLASHVRGELRIAAA